MNETVKLLMRMQRKKEAGTLEALASTWLVGVWILVLFQHPLWVYVVGSIFAAVLAVRLGGSDVMTGSEEFSFSLPATRSDLYWSRFLTGGIPVALFSISAAVIAFYEIPEQVWSLLVDAGVNARVDKPDALLGWSTLAALVPVMTYGFVFAMACLSSSAGRVLSGLFAALVGWVMVLVLVSNLSRATMDESWFVPVVITVCVVFSGLAGGWGHAAYCKKVGLSHGFYSRTKPGMGAALVIAVAVILVVLLLMTFFMRPNISERAMEVEAEAMAAEFRMLDMSTPAPPSDSTEQK